MGGDDAQGAIERVFMLLLHSWTGRTERDGQSRKGAE